MGQPANPGLPEKWPLKWVCVRKKSLHVIDAVSPFFSVLGGNNGNRHSGRDSDGVAVNDPLLGGRHDAGFSVQQRHRADLSREPAMGNVHFVRSRPAADRHVHAVRVQDAQSAGELQRGQVHRLHHVHHLRHLDRLRRPAPQHRENGRYSLIIYSARPTYTTPLKNLSSQPFLEALKWTS